jgi:hypothetical protein
MEFNRRDGPLALMVLHFGRVRDRFAMCSREFAAYETLHLPPSARAVGQPGGTQRYTTIVRTDEDALTHAIIALASQYGRHGYRRIKSLLDEAGWDVGCDRVQRI